MKSHLSLLIIVAVLAVGAMLPVVSWALPIDERPPAQQRVEIEVIDLSRADWGQSLRAKLQSAGHPDPDAGVRAAREAVGRRAAASQRQASRVPPPAPLPAADNDVVFANLNCSFGSPGYALVWWWGPAWLFAQSTGISAFPPFSYIAYAVANGENVENLAMLTASGPWYHKLMSISVEAQYAVSMVNSWCG